MALIERFGLCTMANGQAYIGVGTKRPSIRVRTRSDTVSNDFLPLKAYDHIEFYVGNAKQAAHFYDKTFGFKPIAKMGLETGVRDRASYVMQQGKVRFVLTTALQPDHEISPGA